MQISLEALSADPSTLRQWCEWRDGFELLISPADGDEQRDLFGRIASIKERSNHPQVRDFYLAHVHDWRGLRDRDGSEIAFSAALLRALWKRDIRFSLWLTQTVDDALSFRGAA